MKYYAVKTGNKTGIFETWPECQTAIAGFKNPVFKSFLTKAEAECFLNGTDYWQGVVEKDLKSGYLVAFTDGSFSKEAAKFSYGVHLILPNGQKQNISGCSTNHEFLKTANVAGEVFGVIEALKWAKVNGFKKIKIYHDYQGLARWITSEWRAYSKISLMYVEFYLSIKSEFSEIKFQKVPSHSNISFNDVADKLAKEALLK